MASIQFNPFPILSTDRLTLRALSVEDQQAVFRLRSDPEVNKYLGRKPAKILDDAVQFINLISDNIQQNRSIYWAITLTNTKAFTGSISLFNFTDDYHTCEIGFELLPEYQSQGIMKEAAEMVVRYAFRQLAMGKIEACTHIKNKPSIKLLERLAFIKTSPKDQENPDLGFYCLLKPLASL